MNIKKLMILLAGLFILASCSRPLEDRIERFVNKTEANYETYSEEDWQKSLNEYQALTQEYKDNYQSFSKEEKDRINQALGKYAGILLKRESLPLAMSFRKPSTVLRPSLKEC